MPGNSGKNTSAILLLLLCLIPLTSCQSVYYSAMEKIGVHKRDILVDRVEEARDDQEAAKQQFQTALEKFTEVANFNGGDLEAKYEELKQQLDRCESKAAKLRKRVASIDNVSQALFREWADELAQYNSPELRRRSEEALRDTQQRYDQLARVMNRAVSKMDPVLTAFRDQVLFLKHNLNARAIASLQGDVVELESNVSTLIDEMNEAIREANIFIEGLENAG